MRAASTEHRGRYLGSRTAAPPASPSLPRPDPRLAVGQLVAELKGHANFVKGVSWDPIGRYVAYRERATRWR